MKTYELSDHAQRFWANVDVRSPEECWPWTLSVDGHGYGKFVPVKRVYLVASRVAYELANGGPIKGRVVRHTCDNPICCNPGHLLLGTVADNMKDRDERDRVQQKENHYMAKLDMNAVKDLREEAAPVKLLAARYGVSLSTAYRAKRGDTWK